MSDPSAEQLALFEKAHAEFLKLIGSPDLNPDYTPCLEAKKAWIKAVPQRYRMRHSALSSTAAEDQHYVELFKSVKAEAEGRGRKLASDVESGLPPQSSKSALATIEMHRALDKLKR